MAGVECKCLYVCHGHSVPPLTGKHPAPHEFANLDQDSRQRHRTRCIGHQQTPRWACTQAAYTGSKSTSPEPPATTPIMALISPAVRAAISKSPTVSQHSTRSH
eukprot:COSAG01_NODE_231_length_21019_cov_104.980501_20_plen_104_part_00